MSWIDDQFPNAVGHYNITSEATDDYNCIAWAAGKSDEWWSHLSGYKWPTKQRSSLVESLIAVFESMGYEKCESAAPEDGFEKIAVYSNGRMWKHAARQLPSGQWTSKLGPDEDIEHVNPDVLTGSGYGTVHCIMRRGTTDEQRGEHQEHEADQPSPADDAAGAPEGDGSQTAGE